MDKIISLKNIKKEYSTIEAIRNITLDIYKGEIIAVVGTSGCGKSTLLNIISGLDTKTDGEINFLKDDLKISYMLQNDALLDYRTLLGNASLGLELMHQDNDKNIENVKKLINEFGLSEFMNSKVSSLSGGMRQRVALIRAIAINPDVMLLDEPFSALDYYTRIKISNDIYKLIRKTNTTAIIITHDIREALNFADRIVLLSKRPSTIKKIYTPTFNNKPFLEKKNDDAYNPLYDEIWSELDEKV